MPFFPQAYLPEAALFQLLSELDAPQHPKQQAQQQQQPTTRPACVRRSQCPRSQTYTPRFDVVETAESYQLYGEVPGLRQTDLDIQFTDAQTLTIKGKTERAAVQYPSSATATAESEHIQAQEEVAHVDDSASEHSLSATVEDDYDEADTPLVASSYVEKGKAPESSSSSSASAPAAEPTPAPARQAKYWVAERRVGEFSRSFTFEQRIEADFVTASLQNGVLSVVVPKSLKSKKVAVSVL